MTTNTDITTKPTPAPSGYAWLQDLKVGDKVIEVSGGVTEARAIRSVTSVTKTHIAVTPATRYKRSDGTMAGAGDWNMNRIEQGTPERIAEVNETNLRSNTCYKLRAVKWESFPTDVLLRVLEMVQEEETKKTQ